MVIGDPSQSSRFIYLVLGGPIPAIIGYIFVLVTLLIASAFFSATEMAFSSLNVIRIKQMAKSNKKFRKSAKLVYEVSKNYSELLSTVLVCNNIVNIGLSSIVTYIFVTTLTMDQTGVILATLISSVAIIVFGEIFPKNLAKIAPERIACIVVKPIRVFMFIFKPITYWFGKLNDKMEEKSGVDDKVTATEEELLEIVETIEREGVLEQDESELIQSAIEFDSLSVRAAMTPKEKVAYLYSDNPFVETVNHFRKYKYTRFPVMDKASGKIVGIVYQQDVFDCLANGVEMDMSKLMRKAMYISHRRLLPYALEKVQRQKAHMAIVVDNLKEKNFYGIITLEDILEELVGEIYDEYDDVPNDVVEIGHHIFDVAGTTRIENLFDNYLDDVTLPRTKLVTVGPWVKSLFKGKIKKDAEINYNNLYIKITDCDEHTIKRIEMHQLTKQEENI